MARLNYKNNPVRAFVRGTVIDSWRCCPIILGEQGFNKDCNPNNIAIDNVLWEILIEQNMHDNTSARLNYKTDTYYVDVYIKEEQNTEWIMHTHTVGWKWKTRPRYAYPGAPGPTAGIRTATITCQNILNGLYKCNKKQQYKICMHAYVKREGVSGIIDIVQAGTLRTETADWRWCPDFWMLLDNLKGGGSPPPKDAFGDITFCSMGAAKFDLGPGCSKQPIPHPYGCGPIVLTNKHPLKDDWSNPAFSGIMCPKGLGRNGTGPPDSVMNAVVMNGSPTMPYVDVVQTGPTAGFGANYWEGTEYTLAPYGSGVLISGVFHPSGATGNPTGCAACTGTSSPSVPPTGSGCGTVTYTYDTGVVAWTETSMSDACAGANCQAPAAPWPSAAHGTVKSTGCDPLY